jgi:hypothetical protein
MARCSQLSNLEKSFFLNLATRNATSFDVAHFSYYCWVLWPCYLAWILKQSRAHWLLSDALNFDIFMNLKFSEIATSFNNLMNEDANCCSCINMLSFQHWKGSCDYKPCALNAEFRHFMLSFIKISLLYRYHYKRGLREWKEASRHVEFTDFSNSNTYIICTLYYYPFALLSAHYLPYSPKRNKV